ncbi:hypothetical protein B0A53_04738 [Rhodotorula sp. CCFEE 5036]|nr:hypothetical protein B0A53_04738 [Rhodotorula sp. CCFEE 5036]
MRVFELAPPPPTVPKSSTKSAGATPSSNIPHHALPAALKPLASAQPRRGDTVEMVEVNEPVRNDEERGTGAGRPTSEEMDQGLPRSAAQQDTSERADGANETAEEASAAANGEHDDWRGENGHGGVNGNTAKKDLPPLHVEVRLTPTCGLRFDVLRKFIRQHLESEYESVLTHSEVYDWQDAVVLKNNLERIWIGECSLPAAAVPLDEVSLVIHIYQPPSSSRLIDFSTSPDADEDGDSDVPAASVLHLPSRSLEGIWDSLIYEGNIKEKLLSYIHSTMLFSDAAVDFNIVTWNRVVLLHGPPGTGKTSLCRALAQKLAIRLSDRYEYGKLVEINSHSLFSKWFSESGKLVQRLFAQVTELVEDEASFVVVLIDEVESLTAARAGAMSGKEPSDALRVVNALLTQLDKLKHRKNCLIMTTSNLSEAIDNAFIDRADIKQYIDLPPTAAIYWILRSCLLEIMRVGLVPEVPLMDHKTVEAYRSAGTSAAESSGDNALCCSLMLYELAEQCKGLSGRTLRRLPVLAHARHIAMSYDATVRPKLETWIEAMRKCAAEDNVELEKVNGSR